MFVSFDGWIFHKSVSPFKQGGGGGVLLQIVAKHHSLLYQRENNYNFSNLKSDNLESIRNMEQTLNCKSARYNNSPTYNVMLGTLIQLIDVQLDPLWSSDTAGSVEP